MRVILIAEDGAELWWRQTGVAKAGFTRGSYLHDGTQQKIIASLGEALEQAQGELGCFQVSNSVSDVCATAPEVDSHIPMTGMGDHDPGRERLIMAAEMSVPGAVPVRAKISVIHKENVALVRALDDDNVSAV
jgi:hypothetical protein